MRTTTIKTLIFPFIYLIIILLITGCSRDGDLNPDITTITYSPEQTEQALTYAVGKTGNPYQWGGNGPEQFDCSGLIIWAYRQVDPDMMLKNSNFYSADATVDDIYNFNIREIPPAEMNPGEIVFFTHDENRITHGGLFIEWLDNNTFKYIHASSTSSHSEVRIDNWNLNETAYQWFAGAGHLLKTGSRR